MTIKNKLTTGFSLLELLMAAMFLVVGILPLLWLQSHSKRATMDAYYELLAISLAKEPIEIFTALGYEGLKNYDKNPITFCPIGKSAIKNFSNNDRYPPDADMFEREIKIEDITATNRVNGKKITVIVRPIGKTKIDVWLNREEIRLETVILEHPL